MLFNLSQTCLYALAKANHYRNAGISNCIVFKEKYNLFVYSFFQLQFWKFKNIQYFLEFAVVSVKTDRKNSLTLVCGTLRFCSDIEDYRSSKVQRKYSRFLKYIYLLPQFAEAFLCTGGKLSIFLTFPHWYFVLSSMLWCGIVI